MVTWRTILHTHIQTTGGKSTYARVRGYWGHLQTETDTASAQHITFHTNMQLYNKSDSKSFNKEQKNP